jgi:hypothetical protein
MLLNRYSVSRCLAATFMFAGTATCSDAGEPAPSAAKTSGWTARVAPVETTPPDIIMDIQNFTSARYYGV